MNRLAGIWTGRATTDPDGLEELAVQHVRARSATARRRLTTRRDLTADDRLARSVAAQLSADPVMRHERITVSAQNGIIILIGTVSALDVAAAADAGARRMPGVADVCNALVWRTDLA
jgi:osmotically-inducible protein OsmY